MNTLRRNILPIALLLAGACVAGYVYWVHHSYQDEPYARIEEKLYVGASVQQPPPGTRAVLNLCDRRDPYRAEVHRQEIILDNGNAPSVEWLREMVHFVDEQRNAGRTTYVHCNAGVSRSGLVVTAYLMFEHGWSREQALRFIRSKRREIDPNPAFMQLLDEWENTLRNTGSEP